MSSVVMAEDCETQDQQKQKILIKEESKKMC